MRVEIASSDDLVGLYQRYQQWIAEGYEGALELVFAPGVYGVASIGPITLDLGGNPAPRDPKIDVVLRGSPGTVLRDLGVLVNARSLVVEDLILTGRHTTLIEARVAAKFELRRCAIVGNSYDPPFGNGALVSVRGTFEQPAYSATLEDVWLVRNGELSEAAVIALGPATGSYVYDVQLRRVTSVENTTSADIAILEAKSIEAEDCVCVKAAGAWLRHSRSGAIAIRGGSFSLDRAANVVAGVADPMTPPRSIDIEVTGDVYAREGDVPRGVRIANGVRGGLTADGRAIDALAEQLAAAPVPSDARAKLRAALPGMR